jgi:hypothetical protein
MTQTGVLSRLLRAPRRRRAGRRPRLEWLESRCLPAILIVTSAADNGPGTLRDLVASAQGGDTIGFDPSLAGKTIALTTGAINVDASLTIVGPGITVSGSNKDRVFVIEPGVTVGVTGLTITDGLAVGGTGGGIENLGALALTDCTLSGNSADGGGGIDSSGQFSSLALESCLLVNNTAGGGGGGVAFTGTNLTIHDSTFAGNFAFGEFGGGGLFAVGGALDLRNSTFSDNVASGPGGGLLYQGSAGQAVGCTVAFNQAFSEGGISAGPGSSLTLDSSIAAGNTASGGPNDVGPFVTSSGHNLIQAPDPDFLPAPTDVIGKGPLLGPLQDNGGHTPTRALLAGSPALGLGDPTLAGTADQRGSPRPLAPDIGAYQTEPATQFVVQPPNAVPTGAPFPAQQAGVAFPAEVLALDAQGNVASTFVGNVHFTSTDPQATLPADYTFVATDAGRHSFAGLVLRTAGTEVVAAGDAAAGLAGSALVQVRPGTAVALALGGLPSPDFAGQPAPLTVTALDAFGNLATGYAGTVHFTSTDPAAVLPADFTFGAADGGRHTFPVTLLSLGPQAVTVADASAGLTASGSTLVEALAVLLSGPNRVLAGEPLVLTVTTSPAGAVVNGLTVHWGDGTQDTFAAVPPTVTHVYPRGPNYVGVTVTADTPVAAGAFNVVVLLPQISTFGTGAAGPTQAVVTADVPGVPGIHATLTAHLPHGDIHLLVAVYASNPTPVPLPNAIFYDAVVNGAGPDDRLDVLFRFPPGKASASLVFFDPAAKAFRPVLGSGLGPVRIDLAAGTATVTLDRSSLPTLLALSGTVFAIVLPAEAAVVPGPAENSFGGAAPAPASPTSTSLTAVTLSPALAAGTSTGLAEAGGAGLTQTATFQAGTSLSLSLSPSTANRVSATQSTANGGGEEAGEEDAGPWWRMFRDLFASAAPAPEPPLALVAAPTEALPSGALDALFTAAGGDGAAELDLPPREWEEMAPRAGAPAEEAPALPSDGAWLLALPLLALEAAEVRARREGEGPA